MAAVSRRVDEPVTVHLQGHLPRAFTWRGQQLVVREVVDVWHEVGRWWEGEGEKRFVRLLTAEGTYELCCHLDLGLWYLHRILD